MYHHKAVQTTIVSGDLVYRNYINKVGMLIPMSYVRMSETAIEFHQDLHL